MGVRGFPSGYTLYIGNSVFTDLHDTYYVVSHFHFILSLGTLVSILVGVLYSQEVVVLGFPPYSSPVSVYHYTGIYLGVVVTFLPLHLLGYNPQPRRVYSFPDTYNPWSTLSSLGSVLTVLCLLVVGTLGGVLYIYLISTPATPQYTLVLVAPPGLLVTTR